MENFIWESVIPLLMFFGIIGQIVLVHELGHFIVMKFNKVPVLSFGIGFPLILPWRQKDGWKMKIVRLFSFRLWGTEFHLNPLFLGGYCQQQNDGRPGSLDLFPKRIRISVLAAGSIANLLAAIVIFSVVYLKVVGVPLPQAVIAGVQHTADITTIAAATLANPETYQNSDNFGSLPAMAQITSQMITCSRREGDWNKLSQFAALMNINLALVNLLLPLPGLDGGSILLLLLVDGVAKARGGKKPVKLETVLILSGMSLIVFLMGFLFVKDLLFPIRIALCP